MSELHWCSNISTNELTRYQLLLCYEQTQGFLNRIAWLFTTLWKSEKDPSFQMTRRTKSSWVNSLNDSPKSRKPLLGSGIDYFWISSSLPSALMLNTDFLTFVQSHLFCRGWDLHSYFGAAFSKNFAFELHIPHGIFCCGLVADPLSYQCYFGTTIYTIHLSHLVSDSGVFPTEASKFDKRHAWVWYSKLNLSSNSVVS